MGYFKEYLVADTRDLPPPPKDILDQALHLIKTSKTPDEAKQNLAVLEPHLLTYRTVPELLLPCALLLEKQRVTPGMLETWSDLQVAFPDDPLPLRMLCRWYRRAQEFDEGLQRLHQIVPDRFVDPVQTERAVLGYFELEAFSILDDLMEGTLHKFPQNKAIRLGYIKCLMKQSRLGRAMGVAKALEGQSLAPSARKLLDEVQEKSEHMSELGIEITADALGGLIDTAPARALPSQGKTIGKVMFLTGQLGLGGAERQMTRITQAFRKTWKQGGDLEGYDMPVPPCVCVRHTNPATGADFFLPVLKDAGVLTHILSVHPEPDVSTLDMLDDKTSQLFELLPKDIRRSTLQLVDFLRKEDIQIAYLWQDGGVLTASLACVLAGVPRILTSFRGLPPNMRTELFRPEMPAMYKALFRQTGVTFSANSQTTATAYENWLDLPSGSVKVLLNAVPPVLPEGDAEDYTLWADLVSRSPACTKTVLGIFRYDHNKRPRYWVDLAIEYARNHPDTRFVIVGRGVEETACRIALEKADMEDRVFLVGPSKKVGFWLHKADLLMHLARMEGLPNVIIEAQLAGVPVLATPAGGTGEVLIDGETGLLLSQAAAPPRDEILAKLDALLSDPDRLHTMGQAGLRNAEPKFLLDQVLVRTLDLFSHS